MRLNAVINPIRPFLFFALLTATALACGEPGLVPRQEQTLPPPSEDLFARPTSASLSNWISFSDQGNSYTIDLPKDWSTRHSVGKDYYLDEFQPPNLKELVGVFVFDDAKPFAAGDDQYAFAVSVLNSLYGQVTEVTSRSTDESGREQVTWKSDTSRFTSIYQLRNSTTFLMLTIAGYGGEDEFTGDIKGIVGSFTVH